jgi:hypothetical protein
MPRLAIFLFVSVDCKDRPYVRRTFPNVSDTIVVGHRTDILNFLTIRLDVADLKKET